MNDVEYQAFTMTRLGHTYGAQEDMHIHLPIMKTLFLGIGLIGATDGIRTRTKSLEGFCASH